MDATRSDLEFTAEVLQIALDEGATTINVPDTVGYAMPDEYAAMWRELYRLVPDLAKVVTSVHCHNDLGLAVANSFAGVEAGCRQVECAINGIGERAGNASLEEIVMLLTRPRVGARLPDRRRDARDRAHEPPGLAPDRLPGAAEQGDRRPQRVRARVRHPPGRRAQGAHDLRDHGRDHGRRRDATRSCWASTPAATRCATRSRSWASRSRAQALNTAFKRFKELADKKKKVTALDLEALVSDEMREIAVGVRARVVRRRGVVRAARRSRKVGIRLPGGEVVEGQFTGDGPVDAFFSAINAAARPSRRGCASTT